MLDKSQLCKQYRSSNTWAITGSSSKLAVEFAGHLTSLTLTLGCILDGWDHADILRKFSALCSCGFQASVQKWLTSRLCLTWSTSFATSQFSRTIQNYQKAFRKKVEGMKVCNECS